MIVSNLKTIKRKNQFFGKIQLGQIVNIICDECNKNYQSKYKQVIDSRIIYNKDLCRSCKQKHQYSKGLRDYQKLRIIETVKKTQTGKSYIDRYGEEKAIKLKNNLSKKSSGKNNPMYGRKGLGYGSKFQSSNKGKTYEILYGEEKAFIMRIEKSKAFSGENNPMYGKPAAQGSGNGWQGWYKKWYFRSLLELSFMINIIEKQNIQWESCENKKYKIPYNDWKGIKRNYFPDFILEENKMVEIKPTNFRNNQDVLLKEQAAIEWCKEHNFTYEIIESNSFSKLTKEEITELHDSGQIRFIDRYEEKYKKWTKDVKNSKVN